MPRVESDASVTLVILVYRSMRWLEWCMEGIDRSKNETRYRYLIVANDATDEVVGGLVASGLPWTDYRNADPSEFYIPRVYRAWNHGVASALTPAVVMLNSDMWPSAYWLDQLRWIKKGQPKTVPTSLLIESGRVPSGMPEYVRNHGMNPDEFNAAKFEAHAEEVKRPGLSEPGRLYMPILVDRQEFFDVGAYPEGNPPGTTGDKDLIRRYAEAGFSHVTALGSVVYHAVMGEQHWT